MSKFAEKLWKELMNEALCNNGIEGPSIIDALLKKQRAACAKMADELMILESGEYLGPVDVVIIDPVWPNCPADLLPGADDPLRLFRSAWEIMPRATRAVFVINAIFNAEVEEGSQKGGSVPKSELFAGGQREKTCDSCGHTHPWHSLVCPHAKGANCFECQAILPRHYPWCSAGQRDNFYCWATPRGAQRDLEAHYNTHMKARLAQRVAEARR